VAGTRVYQLQKSMIVHRGWGAPPQPVVLHPRSAMPLVASLVGSNLYSLGNCALGLHSAHAECVRSVQAVHTLLCQHAFPLRGSPSRRHPTTNSESACLRRRRACPTLVSFLTKHSTTTCNNNSYCVNCVRLTVSLCRGQGPKT
jgi:hypothetical protein